LGEAKKELKDGSRSSNKQKLSNWSILLTERGNCHLYEKILKVEMHVLEEGNMKHFKDLFMKYYPMLLMLKEKYGHLRIRRGRSQKWMARDSGLVEEHLGSHVKVQKRRLW
jgi:hypothetical protein